MSIFSRLFGGSKDRPQNAYQSSAPGTLITTAEQLEEVVRGRNVAGSGMSVTPNSAMRVSAVYACVRLISGAVANMPLQIKRRVDDRVRQEASDSSLYRLIVNKPNKWQTPAQFRRWMQAMVLLKGNGYARIVWDYKRENPLELLPLDPDRVECKQQPDLSLKYTYRTANGGQLEIKAADMMHLVGLSLDGIMGVSVLTYARETIGEALAMADHGATLFRNGARASGVLSHPGRLGNDGRGALKASLDEFRAEGERAGKVMILEEGMEFKPIALNAVDSQWIEARQFTRTDIAMFFGVPPSMIGDNTGADSNWGTGLEQKANGFVTFTLEDHLTMWEQTIARDLIADPESKLYAIFNRSALVRGDIGARYEAYMKGRQMKVLSANDVRALEDMNPVPGGDEYDNPLITVKKDQTP